MPPAPAAPTPPAPTTQDLLGQVRQRAARAEVKLCCRYHRVVYLLGAQPRPEVVHWHLFLWQPGMEAHDDIFLSKAGDSAEEALTQALQDPAWDLR